MASNASLSGDLIFRLDNGQEVTVGRIELPLRVSLGPEGPPIHGPNSTSPNTLVRDTSRAEREDRARAASAASVPRPIPGA